MPFHATPAHPSNVPVGWSAACVPGKPGKPPGVRLLPTTVVTRGRTLQNPGMCGIVGYVGPRAATPILVDGLRKLEYRGYDSAGLAVHDGKTIEIVRAVGKLAHLDEALAKHPLSGTTGIGHTRWATHGRPSEHNAHPHSAGDVAVVHNGIIENHVALRHALEADGVRFASDTDTEIIAHLVDRAIGAGAPSLFDAVRTALGPVEGAYAIAVVSNSAPARI